MRVSLLLLLISSSLFAKSYKGYEVDEQEKNKKYDVKLLTGKKGDVRIYHAQKEVTLNADVPTVIKSIVNFEDKCNNELSDKRILMNKDKKCRYDNGNLIESKIITNIKNKNVNVKDQFVIKRRIYNRELFNHIDLVTIKDLKAGEVTTISIEMQSDKQASKFLKPDFKNNSVFLSASSFFKVIKLKENKTKVIFTYTSTTNHWLVNKSFAVSKVFDNVAKSLGKLFTSIQNESQFLIVKR